MQGMHANDDPERRGAASSSDAVGGTPAEQERCPVVIVVGGGFGGIEAAKRLKRAHARILLIDRRNHHLFQPLLYQVATAALSPGDISEPIRRIVRSQANTSVLLGEVSSVDTARRVVRVGETELSYDYLVLAAGATHSYMGHDDWAPLAPGLKTVEDALEIRRRILLAFEEAELESAEESRRAKLTFVVVGGGPTGVEMAGAIKEIAAQSLPRDFRNIDTTTTRVILVQAADRLLPAMHPSLGERARRDLERMGVEVRVHSRVTHVDKDCVYVGEEPIEASNVIWAAGVRPSPLGETLGVELDRSGRVPVRPDLSIEGHPEVFVIGDLALARATPDAKPVPGVAQGAIQMGRFVGRVIRDEIASGAPVGQGRQDKAFRYKDKGTLATIGRNHAVAEMGKVRLGGTMAWLAWSIVHVFFLIGFHNKIQVVLGWMWNYIVFAKGARLITGDVRVEVKHPDPFDTDRHARARDLPCVETPSVGAEAPGDAEQRPTAEGGEGG